MPYIKEEDRDRLWDEEGKFGFLPEPKNAGEFNFIVSTMCNTYLLNQGLRYEHINSLIGALECAKLELYRRIASTYEDEKVKENGDVYDKDFRPYRTATV